MVEISTGKPYSDQLNLFDNGFVRTFDDVDNDELVWHRDHKTRSFKVLICDGWKFQKDNELPFELQPGNVIKIEKGIYHRLHKGNGQLKIEIEEHD